MRAHICLIAILLLIGQGYTQLNDNVVIGVYLEPSEYSEYPSDKYSYVAASYVKYIEMAGAQVVPIHYDGNQQYYDSIFSQINGLLFPGGSVEIGNNQFTNNAKYLVEKAINASQSGVNFPVWGTCLGFELLMTIIAETEVLTRISNESGVTHPIQIVKNGELFNQMPAYLYTISQTQPIWYFNHQYCVTPTTYNKNIKLKNFYNVLALAQNLQNETFIAAVEAKDYPIFGVQFHPEKNNYEWRVKSNHGLNAIMGSQYFADFFVQQARLNQHNFTSQTVLNNNLIYNWNPVVLPPNESSFTQIYFVPNFSNQTVLEY